MADDGTLLERVGEAAQPAAPAAPAASAVGAPANEVATPAERASATARRFRGWYVLGLSTQVLFWTLVFLGLVTAIAVGGHLTEFRYVGF